MNSIGINSYIFLPALAQIVLLVLLPMDQHVIAEDVIIIKRPSGEITKRTGVIVDWQGDRISIDSGGRTRKVNAAEVTQLNTNWPEDLAVARKFVKEKDLASAATAYQRALASESRNWVKSIIGNELLQVFDASQNHRQAIAEFLKIYAGDNSTRFFHLIPLAWSTGEQNLPATPELKKWMISDKPVLCLIGCSWSLSRGSNDEAIAKLEQLAANPDKRIAQLALGQLWRTRLLSATETDVQRWQRQIENIDLALRAGPLTVLAQAQNRIGENEDAQINLMQVRILHDDKKSLAAFALYQCGNIMSDLNQKDRAKSLWRELVEKFPASQYAALAGNKM